MQKKYLLLTVIIFILGITFTRSLINKQENTVKLAEVTHSIFYAPLYVAIEEGYFKDNNINLELILVSGADKVATAVLSDDVQIGLAGPESAIYVYKGGNKDFLVTFAGLTKRDGQFIVGKEKIANFTLKGLYNKEILVGRSTGMPALNFLNALKKQEIDATKITINTSIDFASLSGAFLAGTGDFVNLFEPNVSKLENMGYYVYDNIGLYSGQMPYTAFYTKKSYFANNQELINNFRQAINQGLNYIYSHSDYEIAKTIKNQFPDNTIDEIEQIVARYKNNDTWLKNTTITEELYQNLEDIMIDNNLLDEYVPFDELVINE